MIEKGCLENTDDFFDQIDGLLGGGLIGGLEGCFSATGDGEMFSGSSFSSAYSGDSVSSMEEDFAAGLSFSCDCEDLAQLEWVSTIFEDSFPDEKFHFDSDDKNEDSSRFQTSSPVSVLETRPVQLSPERVVPVRARTKRSRPTSLSRTQLNTASAESDSEPPKKKKGKEKKKMVDSVRVNSVRVDSGVVRRCRHCGIEKTPQWRMGPMGPKTLCNACGVRYKSGRLFPEYRPAASPTFVAAIHSNSHKKVMEMRSKSG